MERYICSDWWSPKAWAAHVASIPIMQHWRVLSLLGYRCIGDIIVQDIHSKDIHSKDSLTAPPLPPELFSNFLQNAFRILTVLHVLTGRAGCRAGRGGDVSCHTCQRQWQAVEGMSVAVSHGCSRNWPHQKFHVWISLASFPVYCSQQIQEDQEGPEEVDTSALFCRNRLKP